MFLRITEFCDLDGEFHNNYNNNNNNKTTVGFMMHIINDFPTKLLEALYFTVISKLFP